MELRGKHVVDELDGVRCTIVESGLTGERKEFLSQLLRQNGFEVKTTPGVGKEENASETWILGVTDILLNPVIVLYQQKFFREDGKVVTPAFWREDFTEADLPYWQVKQY